MHVATDSWPNGIGTTNDLCSLFDIKNLQRCVSATIQNSGVLIVSSRTFVDAHGRHYVVELLLDFVFYADAEFMRH